MRNLQPKSTQAIHNYIFINESMYAVVWSRKIKSILRSICSATNNITLVEPVSMDKRYRLPFDSVNFQHNYYRIIDSLIMYRISELRMSEIPDNIWNPDGGMAFVTSLKVQVT